MILTRRFSIRKYNSRTISSLSKSMKKRPRSSKPSTARNAMSGPEKTGSGSLSSKKALAFSFRRLSSSTEQSLDSSPQDGSPGDMEFPKI
jgi:hypothetical protein